MTPRVLVAGIGNIFCSDDGFGVEVVNRMLRMPAREGVRVEDFGIRGLHLAYELVDGNYDVLILVDAVPVGNEPPGTVVVLEPDPPPPPGDADEVPAGMDGHTMSPDVVLRSLSNLGGSVDRILVVGCQPETVEEGMGLSDPVAHAIDRAIEVVSELLTEVVSELLTHVCQPAGRETRT